MLNWHLIYTKPKNEDTVSHKLGNAGFAVLDPKLKERRYIRRKLQDVISPLFPCYIFVKFNYPEDYRLIKYTRGVRRIIGFGDSLTVVPEEIISSIQNRVQEGVITIRPPRFEPGEEVMIKAGPFQGFNAIFEKELKGTERVSILLKEVNARVVVDSAVMVRA